MSVNNNLNDNTPDIYLISRHDLRYAHTIDYTFLSDCSEQIKCPTTLNMFLGQGCLKINSPSVTKSMHGPLASFKIYIY